MGAFADSLFTLLLGWVRGLVSAIMTLFSSGGKNGLIPFLGKNWLLIVLVILAVGLAVDWFIWMLRWQPYRVWGTKMRRIARALHLRPQDDEAADEIRTQIEEKVLYDVDYEKFIAYVDGEECYQTAYEVKAALRKVKGA